MFFGGTNRFIYRRKRYNLIYNYLIIKNNKIQIRII